MKALIIPILFIFLLSSCSKPPMVCHMLRPDIKYIRPQNSGGYGRPAHNHLNYLICFDDHCRSKAAWIKKIKSYSIKIKPIKKKQQEKKIEEKEEQNLPRYNN